MAKGNSKTVNEVIEDIGFGKYQIFILVVCGLLTTGEAMETLLLTFLGRTLQCEWRISSNEVALLTTSVFMGMIFGGTLMGMLSDRYGRYPSLLIGVVILTFYGLLSATAPNLVWLLILRACVGYGVGCTLTNTTALTSEFMPIKTRAKMTAAMKACWIIGTFIEIGLARSILGVVHTSNSWRWLAVGTAIPQAFNLILFVILPESPRFLVATGQKRKSKEVLNKIAAANGKPTFEGNLIEDQQHNRGNFKTLLSNSIYVKMTILLTIIWFSNGFLYYGSILLTVIIPVTQHRCLQAFNTQYSSISTNATLECCLPLSDQDYVTILAATVGEFLGDVLVILTIDIIGRKKLMIACFSSFSLLVIGFQFCVPLVATNILLAACRALINCAYTTSYVYSNEAYPTSIRAMGVGINSSVSKLGAMLSPFVAQILLPDASMLAALIIYSAVSIAAAVSTFLLPFETKHRLLKHSVDDDPLRNKERNAESIPLTTNSKDYDSIEKNK